MKQFYVKDFSTVSISVYIFYTLKRVNPSFYLLDSIEQTKKIGKIEFSKEVKRRNSIITKCCVCHGS